MVEKRHAAISDAIQTVIKDMMDRVMQNVLVDDPFLAEAHHSKKPLYAALVPDEIFKGSHFERRFVTPFGGVWEKLAKVVAQQAHGNCTQSHTISGTVGAESLRRIQEVLNSLEHSKHGKKKVKPDWIQEIEYVKAGGGELIPTSVVCDIFINSRSDNNKYAFELKAPLPNSDQTKVSKEKIFKLLCMSPPQVDFAYYALPYNPYGKRENYAWSFPARWFDMRNDECVLIGDEFWDLIGGKGTYKNFIREINTLGTDYKTRIYEDFLGIPSPKVGSSGLLK
jgi:hypothetical protein